MWYHGRCVGLRERDGKFVDVYVCDKCTKEGKGIELSLDFVDLLLTILGTTEWNSEFRKRLALQELQGTIPKKPRLDGEGLDQATLIAERNKLMEERKRQREEEVQRQRDLARKRQREEAEK